MRVLVGVDAMVGLSSLEAGTIIARAWADAGAEVALVPMGSDAHSVMAALAWLGASVEVVDLTEALPDRVPPGVVGLVDSAERDRPLTGLHGVAATAGRDQCADIASVLAADDEAARWARETWPDNPHAATAPGGGAHGGRGLVVLAAGGRLETGPALIGQVANLQDTAFAADLIITGCDTLDFGTFGGPVIEQVVQVATSAARPIIVLTSHNAISARELRQAGIESAHVMDEAATPDALAVLARRVASAWNQPAWAGVDSYVDSSQTQTSKVDHD